MCQTTTVSFADSAWDVSEEFTRPLLPRGGRAQWVRQVEACETEVCEHGFAIRGLLQRGKYVWVIHDAHVRHSCSFRGRVSPEMERYYNGAATD